METNMETNEEKSGVKKGPARRFKAGAISANVWKNAGEKGEYFTVSLGRSYKDKAGQWKTTGTLRVDDLPKASMILDEAFKFVVMHKQEAL